MKKKFIKTAAICMSATLCLGSFEPAGIAGISVYAQTDEISEDVIGQYITQGYENPTLGFKVQLPDNYVLEARESLVQLNEDQNADVVEQSNSDGAYSKIRMNAGFGNITSVFSSYTENMDSSIFIYIQTTGIGMDHWDEESVVAENTSQTYQEQLQEVAGEEGQITDFEVNVDSYEFAGKEHAVGMYKCNLNGIPFYGAQIYMRSDDKQYMIIVDLQSTNADELVNMESYFSAL